MKSNGAAAAPAVVHGAAGLPDDPAAFVAAAEDITNRADPVGAAAVYASDAVLESFTDGAHERYVGKTAVGMAWRSYMSALSSQRFRLTKRLLVAADGVIVNEWSGQIGNARRSAGIEYWIFNNDGEVRRHCMYSSLSVQPSTSWRQRLRMLFAYPRTALAFDRARRQR